MMNIEGEIVETDASGYACALEKWCEDVFLTPAFNSLNRNKCDRVRYLLFYKRELLLGGIILGERNYLLESPFSAPYGGFIFTDSGKTEVEYVISLFLGFIKKENKECRLTFPASISPDNTCVCNNLVCSRLCSQGFRVLYADTDYFIDLDDFSPDANVVRRWRRGKEREYRFRFTRFDVRDLEQCYNVIRENHRALGYYLSMSQEAFAATSRIADVHLCWVEVGEVVTAAAIIYATRKQIFQLISWGDLVEYRRGGGIMSFLAMELIFYIRKNVRNIKVLDLGPSSLHGELNQGLANFKKSLGAKKAHKFTLTFTPFCSHDIEE